MRVVIETNVLEQIVQHARECLPEEGCGFLVGRGPSVDRFLPAPNALRSETAFEVEPEFLFELFRQIRVSGEDLVGIYHSHPRGPAVPSPRDVAEAYYPECTHIIVSLAGPEPEVRAYRILDEEVLEIELHAIV